MNARHTRPRTGRRKAEGQSIPLIAVMLVVLIGFVALSVDVGSAYAEQRAVVRATNAAVLAGMSAVLRDATDDVVLGAIQQSLISNGIDLNMEGRPGRYTMTATYLRGDGTAAFTVGSAAGGAVPDDVEYIQLTLKGGVDTTFARLFNISEVPLGSTMYSGRRICETGVYPIMVNTKVGQGSAFNSAGDWASPRSVYTDDSIGQVLNVQRVYLGNVSRPNFNFVRWTPDMPNVLNANDTTNTNGIANLAMMFAGQGNLQVGFEEMTTWPPNSTAVMPPEWADPELRKLAFPFEEGVLNPLDWVYGNRVNSAALGTAINTGDATITPLEASLNWHIENRTIMTLLTYEHHSGSTADPAYRLEKHMAFLMLEYGIDPTEGFYLDLALIPNGVRECPAPVTPPPPTIQVFGLGGAVEFWPRWQENIVAAVRPVAFLIIFDVTGSMTWTFDGKGQNPESGETVYCTGPNRNANCGGFLWAYGNRDDPATPVDERTRYRDRRVYIAKDVLRQFALDIDNQRLSGLRPNDIVRILPFTGDVGDFYNGENPATNAGQSSTQIVNEIKSRLVPGAWVNTYAALDGAINNAGSVNGDQYLTNGATSSASALKAAYEILNGPDTPDHVPGNAALEYRKIVIFVTDGVANVFTNGLYNNKSDCTGEFQECNLGTVTLPNGTVVSKPIDAMVEEALELKNDLLIPTDGKLYVIALAGVDTTGLANVASEPSMAQEARDPEALGRILSDIRQDAQFGECVPGDAPRPVAQLDTSNIGSIAGWDLGNGEAGYVYLWRDNRDPLVDEPDFTVPIRIDTTTRTMTYSFSDLPPGNYLMRAALGVRWVDGTDRLYTQFRSGAATGDIQTLQINESRAGLGGQINYPLTLDLGGSPCQNMEN